MGFYELVNKFVNLWKYKSRTF